MIFFLILRSLNFHILIHTIVSLSTITSTLKSRPLSKVMMVLKVTKERKVRQFHPHVIMKIGVLQYITALQRLIKMLCVYVTA